MLRRLIYWAYARRQGRRRRFEEMQDWQRLDRTTLRRRQAQRLERVVRFAARRTEFYAQRFRQSGLVDAAGDVRMDRFAETATLERADLQRHGPTMVADGEPGPGSSWNGTSGSTGEPVRVLQDREYASWNIATKFLHQKWVGCEPMQPQVHLWGAATDLARPSANMGARLGAWTRRETLLDTRTLSPERIRRYLRIIDEVRPKLLLVYAIAGVHVARFALDENLKPRPVGAIMSSASALLAPMRQAMEDAFGARVFNRYGSREVGDMACECEAHDGLHVTAPTHYVEVLGADGQPVGPGETGQVVVTSLTNLAMPLIRYRIGDMATIDDAPCPCGRSWPRFGKILGRSNDTLVAEDGSTVDPSFVQALLSRLVRAPWIGRYQLTQRAVDRVLLQIQPVRPGTPTDVDPTFAQDAQEAVRGVLGADCAVSIELVDEIPLGPGGKLRYVVSMVGDQGQPESANAPPRVRSDDR